MHRCLQVGAYNVTHGELPQACRCPMVKGIECRLSCLGVFAVFHNDVVLSLLKKFDTYPDGDFHKDNCPTYKSQAEHPSIGATIEVSTFFNVSDAL